MLIEQQVIQATKNQRINYMKDEVVAEILKKQHKIKNRLSISS